MKKKIFDLMASKGAEFSEEHQIQQIQLESGWRVVHFLNESVINYESGVDTQRLSYNAETLESEIQEKENVRFL